MANVHYLLDPQAVQNRTARYRALIGIAELDSRLQEQIAEHERFKLFHITLWRDESDMTCCDWNARVDKIKGNWISDLAWWGVVPQLRQRFNLL